MLDDELVPDTTATTGSGDDSSPGSPGDAETPPQVKKRTRKAPAKRAEKVAATDEPPAAEASTTTADTDETDAKPVKKAAAKRTSRPRAKKAAATDTEPDAPAAEAPAAADEAPLTPADGAPPARKRSRAKKAAPAPEQPVVEEEPTEDPAATDEPQPALGGLLFKAPEPTTAPRRSRRARQDKPADDETKTDEAKTDEAKTDETGPDDAPSPDAPTRDQSDDSDEDSEDGGGARRRRRRGGRRRRKSSDGDTDESSESVDGDEPSDESTAGSTGDGDSGESATSRRRRRRRRAGEEGDESGGDDAKTVTRVRRGRKAEDEITAVSGSTRLEAKKQRRREGREAGRRRAPIVSEAEFLARRESVERVMAIRQRDDVTQIAVLEDKVLVEHYVARESQTSLIGNVYLGRVQNVLPSMEAAFVDIGKGRNAVLYAGEVNWSALGQKEGQARKIESVLSSGQPVLVQVTKDPVGHKGARLTSQISLAGRFLVYVPDGTTSGISRKLPDTERGRLKTLLKDIVPDTAGVIVRTAAEGAAEDELTRDVERLKARWEDIERKAANKGASAQLLYGEPDLTLKVVRDLFTEDFVRLVVEGDDAWDIVQQYVAHVAPDLEERLERHDPSSDQQSRDLFGSLRIEEQIHKGLDRKVWLPSGGSLVIDRTEAMTVVDVNTGKFTGSGGNLEETVTKNNLEAAEEIVRQLRLRDIGGIIVVDFIDMVLESNRDLVLRRLVECLGRDRTRHQVAEVTSLGLVQMTRKRIGTGLLEAFSENCDHCAGRGVVVQDAPVEPRRLEDPARGGGGRARGRGGRGRGDTDGSGGGGNGGNGGKGGNGGAKAAVPSPRDVAAMARVENAERAPLDEDALEAIDAALLDETTPAEESAAQVEEVQDLAPEPEAPEPEAPMSEAPEPEAPEPEAPSAPKVVTRTRRRAASRPAGPPATGQSIDAQSSGGQGVGTDAPGGFAAADGLVDAAIAGEAPHVEHVPIKKRGARKR